ncbi:unnamed protein product [Symbiodinium microadriaticum]|nr:unnamed protein product [Symbiodinium sp. KB8]CAE7820368.1 unnamed protein product [Symbiodinium microadriaticum]
MGRFGCACLLLAASAVCAEVPWKAWLQSFGHDSFRYPAWIKEQMEACHCRIHDRLHVQCWGEEGNAVMWQTARELDWCVARQFLLSHMPEFDLHFLPGSVSVDGESMLDDNIAFALMAWNASNLSPRPPMAVVLPYLLPYASYHEARSNWRPLFFAKYFSAAAEFQSSQAVVDALIGDGVRLMNWTSFKWADFPGKSESNIYELGPFASGSTPPVVAPADFLLYGYGSCTAWAKFLSSALRAVGVPAREVGSPCWNTGIFTGLAESNANVSLCWQGGVSGGPVGGTYLNNHNWVEYWDNTAHTWRFLDVATSSSSETTWFCGKFQDGCSCTSNAGLAMQIILCKLYMALASRPFQPYSGRPLAFGQSLARRDKREPISSQLGCRCRGQAALHLCLAGVGWQRAGGKAVLRARASRPHGPRPRKATATELDGHIVSPVTGSPHRYTLIYLHGLGGAGGSYVSADSELELPWRLGDSYAPGLRAVLPSAPSMAQPWGEELASWYVYRALTSNEVADAESLASVRRALDEVIRNEVRHLAGDGRRVFLGGISQGCNMALDAYLRLASTLNLGGFVGSVGFLPSDRQGFPGSDRALRTLLEDSRQVLQPVWLQSAPGDADEVPYDLVQSSLLRARSGWAGLQLQKIEGVGHDIGQFEASILNEFLRQHASDAYFEDHEILAPTWSAVGDDPEVHGGPILDVAKDLVLSSGEAVSPLVWSPRLTSPLGIPLKNVGLRFQRRCLCFAMVTTQQNAQQEVLRFSEFYKLRDADFRPNPVTHLRYDSLNINFTNAGSLTRAIRRGKHVEPLCKILPSCRMVPVKAGLPDAMMRPRYPSEPSLGLDVGKARVQDSLKRRTSDSELSQISLASSRAQEATVPLHWPCAAPLDRPSRSRRSKGARRHRRLAKAMEAATFKLPASQEVGCHEPRAPIRNGNELGPYLNPFLTRFHDRRPGGGFFAGSGLAAGKVTAMPPAAATR